MPSTAEAAFRALCLRCRRPRAVCWCGALRPVGSRTRVVFLQHPRESRVAVSTCRMAHLSLPNSELHVGLGLPASTGSRLCVGLRAPRCSSPRRAPPTYARCASRLRCWSWSTGPGPTRRRWSKTPLLSALPRVSLTPDRPGNYRIRKEPEAHCLSTIEAVAAVLEHLEGAPGRFTPILAAFDHMVEQQLDFIRSTGANSRHRRTLKRRNSVREDPTAAMKADAARLVVVFGEANAWPADAANRPLPDVPELLALVAERVATGESFEALMQARRPLSPSVPCQLDLPAEALEAAEPARWPSPAGASTCDRTTCWWAGGLSAPACSRPRACASAASSICAPCSRAGLLAGQAASRPARRCWAPRCPWEGPGAAAADGLGHRREGHAHRRAASPPRLTRRRR